MARGVLSPLVVLGALALTGAACDVRPLTAHELYGAGGAGGAGGVGGAGGTVVDGAAAPDVGGTDALVVDATPLPGCRAVACPVDTFCNELVGECVPSTGVGMLSGQVFDACSGQIISALVGIANQHMCSFLGKGSYFFTQLPLGLLRLSAGKAGYEAARIDVNIVSGGVIKDIRLERVGGCEAPAPDPGSCTCTFANCVQ